MRILEIKTKASCISVIIEGQRVFGMHDLLASSELHLTLRFSPYNTVETGHFVTAVMNQMLPWNSTTPVGVFTVWKSSQHFLFKLLLESFSKLSTCLLLR